MEYTELADYRIPGGSLTAWEPVAHQDAWRDDPRRLSYVHVEHARRAQLVGAGWYSEWIGTAFLVEHALDRDALAATIEEWYRRHEAFRSSVRTDSDVTPEDELTRITAPPQAISVRGTSLGEDLDDAQAHAAVQEYFNTTVSPLRWPHCVAVTVEPAGRDDCFLLMFAADHTVMDAYTQVFAIRELTTLYEAALAQQPHNLIDYGSYLDFADAERCLGEQIDANNSAVALWRRFFDTSTNTAQPVAMPTFPRFEVPDEQATVASRRPPTTGFQASLSRYLLDGTETKLLDGICKTAGGSLAAGIYAALAMANTALTGEADLRFVSPIHTRTGPQWGEAVGWFVGVIPMHVRSGGAATFTQALSAVTASVGEYRDAGAAPFAPIADLIGGDTTPPGFVVSYIDLRRAEGAERWDAREARVLRSATADADEVYFWINRIPDGLNISARYPAGPAGRAVEVFLSRFHSILTNVVAEGDCSVEVAARGALASERR
ncbi:condensation domain-containing protein [Gordonia sp. DT30]|uniref:condensation domain-containing protein n=1 Tax=Gordonia sp. DT30 TaxID=3416546 RepID=UPI003CE6C568